MGYVSFREGIHPYLYTQSRLEPGSLGRTRCVGPNHPSKNQRSRSRDTYCGRFGCLASGWGRCWGASWGIRSDESVMTNDSNDLKVFVVFKVFFFSETLVTLGETVIIVGIGSVHPWMLNEWMIHEVDLKVEQELLHHINNVWMVR